MDIAMLQKEFKTAMTCDAYVLCVDASDALTGVQMGIVDEAEMICNCAKEIQENRMACSDAAEFAPMMVLFINPDELVAEFPESRCNEWVERPTYERIHMLSAEVQQIKTVKNPIYISMSRRLEVMSVVYYAQMRCSPYGYAALPCGRRRMSPCDYVPKPSAYAGLVVQAFRRPWCIDSGFMVHAFR